jgi:hypothetical protein
MYMVRLDDHVQRLEQRDHHGTAANVCFRQMAVDHSFVRSTEEAIDTQFNTANAVLLVLASSKTLQSHVNVQTGLRL